MKQEWCDNWDRIWLQGKDSPRSEQLASDSQFLSSLRLSFLMFHFLHKAFQDVMKSTPAWFMATVYCIQRKANRHSVVGLTDFFTAVRWLTSFPGIIPSWIRTSYSWSRDGGSQVVATWWVSLVPMWQWKITFILPHPRKDTLYQPVWDSNFLQLPVFHHGDTVVKCGLFASAYIRETCFRFRDHNSTTVFVNLVRAQRKIWEWCNF